MCYISFFSEPRLWCWYNCISNFQCVSRWWCRIWTKSLCFISACVSRSNLAAFVCVQVIGSTLSIWMRLALWHEHASCIVRSGVQWVGGGRSRRCKTLQATSGARASTPRYPSSCMDDQKAKWQLTHFLMRLSMWVPTTTLFALSNLKLNVNARQNANVKPV
jgi:hypothetical protein